eukprot:2413785-Amphidinium_carterae.1
MFVLARLGLTELILHNIVSTPTNRKQLQSTLRSGGSQDGEGDACRDVRGLEEACAGLASGIPQTLHINGGT